ncbi:MAG: succinyl-diaminopimelate desuccinylase [Hydrotalea sp.]|nr:succinyl-diaminopimelate desuccinylase [Hydrotalea sp.]
MEKSTALILTEKLIACPSVTPRDGGAMAVLIAFLEKLGFTCNIYEFGDGVHKTKNLYAKWGKGENNLAFAGHVDVVPVGDETKWSSPPFAPTIIDGFLHGRGAIDMKGGVACWCAALEKFLKNSSAERATNAALSLLITGDEEGHAKFGTKKLLEQIDSDGEKISACITGEPTCPTILGDMIKIGRRGGLTGTLTVHGTMGHTGYPQLADNPLHRLVDMLAVLKNWQIDKGNEKFQPSQLSITTIDTGNRATNVIPNKVMASINLRFNNEQTGDGLIKKIEAMLQPFDKTKWHIDWFLNGDSFLTPEGAVSKKLQAAIKKVTGQTAVLDTLGGTSDSRFIKNYCPVVLDFGHVNQTIHQVDERVALKDLEDLTEIYYQFMVAYFSA